MNKHTKTLFLFMLAPFFTFLALISAGKAMHSDSGLLYTNPIYLPLVERNYGSSLFGITLYAFDEPGGLIQAIQAGTNWSRSGVSWKVIEPNPGDRNWGTQAGVEQGLIKAASMSLQPIMLIDGTPDWALKAGYLCGAVAENQLAALGQFAYDLVMRYSKPPYYVHTWELWNEPDVYGGLGCWGDVHDPYYGGEYYGLMLREVYPRIKQADPGAQVLVGGLLLDCDPEDPPGEKDCTSSLFLKGTLESGGGPYFDGISFHAYDFYTGKGTYENQNWHSSSSTTGPVSIAKARYLKNLLAEYGYPEKYLLNTETAVFYGPNVMEPVCVESAPADTEITKVYYVAQSYAVAVADGWKANVWYSMFGVRCSGLLNLDLSPKGALLAYQFSRQKLGGAVFLRPIDEYEGMMGYEYALPGRKLWVIWSMDGVARTIDLPELPIQVNRLGEDGRAIQEPNMTSISFGPSDFSPRFSEFTH